MTFSKMYPNTEQKNKDIRQDLLPTTSTTTTTATTTTVITTIVTTPM